MNYEWSEEMSEKAQTIIDQDESLMTEEKITKLENYQRLHWDVFFKNNKDHAYKDRHYIRYEFTDLTEAIQSKQECTLLDYGCGTGAGFYPLAKDLDTNFEYLRVNACDISKTAVRLLKEHEMFKEDRIEAHQCDLVNDEIPFEPKTADFCLILFVLSAITPEKYPLVLAKLADQMKPGGVVYFRDYGRYDMAQLRFAKRGNQKLGDNFYLRTEHKTRAYYFALEEVTEMFANAGFEMIENKFCHRVIENRKE